MRDDTVLRQHLVELLRGRDAHVNFDTVIAGLPTKLRGAKPKGLPFTPWRLLEHMRIAQWDILEFSRNPKHVSPKFPENYWPKGDAPPDAAAWKASVESFRADLGAMQALVENPDTDLFAPIPHGQGQTIEQQPQSARQRAALRLQPGDQHRAEERQQDEASQPGKSGQTCVCGLH